MLSRIRSNAGQDGTNSPSSHILTRGFDCTSRRPVVPVSIPQSLARASDELCRMPSGFFNEGLAKPIGARVRQSRSNSPNLLNKYSIPGVAFCKNSGTPQHPDHTRIGILTVGRTRISAAGVRSTRVKAFRRAAAARHFIAVKARRLRPCAINDGALHR